MTSLKSNHGQQMFLFGIYQVV